MTVALVILSLMLSMITAAMLYALTRALKFIALLSAALGVAKAAMKEAGVELPEFDLDGVEIDVKVEEDEG